MQGEGGLPVESSVARQSSAVFSTVNPTLLEHLSRGALELFQNPNAFCVERVDCFLASKVSST
ncbi:hypothetical protein NNJEOMEG_00621 [Fundidesulfovibrio magnetotacticus]|uniref:Uncharacterized protein n=1 Tax=Fundidesulfovibrio magnetotacticus TaxID=2730080 RepID=A0A6V8LM61_9BACT|nr:hypothetical protein NNJEOMEG_00621 [Fundidesulfovibrio magnetotacticus]